MSNFRAKIKLLIFKIIRPLFVRNIDSNEDFCCTICGNPVLYRQLTCSKICSDRLNTMEINDE